MQGRAPTEALRQRRVRSVGMDVEQLQDAVNCRSCVAPCSCKPVAFEVSSATPIRNGDCWAVRPFCSVAESSSSRIQLAATARARPSEALGLLPLPSTLGARKFLYAAGSVESTVTVVEQPPFRPDTAV